MIPYISGGETPTAALMNTIFEEADRKLSLALSDHSIFFWPGWRGNPDAGLTRFVGPMYFFIDGTPSVYSHIWRDDYIAYGTGNNYNHTLFTDAVAGCPFVQGYEDTVLNTKMIDGSSGAITTLLAALNNQEYNKTPLSRSLGTIQKDGYNLVTNDPFFFCPIRWAQAELVFEGHTAYTIPKEWNRFNFFRIHNLSGSPLTVAFEGQPEYGGGHGITIPPYGSKCVRRGAWGWLDGYNHFHKFRDGDPRFWNHSFGNSLARPPSSTAYANNNITNPGRLLDLFHRMTKDHPMGKGLMCFDERRFWDADLHFSQTSNMPGTVPAPVNDAGQDRGYYGSVKDSDNLLGDILFSRGKVGTVKMIADATQGAVVQGTTATHQESVFMGINGARNEWENFVNGLEDVTMQIQADGSLLIQKAAGVGNIDLDIISIGCNMIMQALGGERFAHALSAFPYASGPLWRRNKAGDVVMKDGMLQQARVDNANGVNANWDNLGIGASGPLIIPALSAPTINAFRSYSLKNTVQFSTNHQVPNAVSIIEGDDSTTLWSITANVSGYYNHSTSVSRVTNPDRTPSSSGMSVFTTKISGLVDLHHFGSSVHVANAANVELRMTAFGPILLFDEVLDYSFPPEEFQFEASTCQSWAANSATRKLIYNLGERYFPTWYSLKGTAPVGTADMDLTNFHYARFKRLMSTEAFLRSDENRVYFEDDKLRRIIVHQNREFHLPGSNVYAQGLGCWLEGRNSPFKNPNAGSLTPFLTQTSLPIWYSKTRGSILANKTYDKTGAGVPIGCASEGQIWFRNSSFTSLESTFGYVRLPLAAEHYNALASVVNACYRVRVLSVNDFLDLDNPLYAFLYEIPNGMTPNGPLLCSVDFAMRLLPADPAGGLTQSPFTDSWWLARGVTVRGVSDIAIKNNGAVSNCGVAVPNKRKTIRSYNAFPTAPTNPHHNSFQPGRTYGEPVFGITVLEEVGESESGSIFGTIYQSELTPVNYPWLKIDDIAFAGLGFRLKRVSIPYAREIKDVEYVASENTCFTRSYWGGTSESYPWIQYDRYLVSTEESYQWSSFDPSEHTSNPWVATSSLPGRLIFDVQASSESEINQIVKLPEGIEFITKTPTPLPRKIELALGWGGGLKWRPIDERRRVTFPYGAGPFYGIYEAPFLTNYDWWGNPVLNYTFSAGGGAALFPYTLGLFRAGFFVAGGPFTVVSLVSDFWPAIPPGGWYELNGTGPTLDTPWLRLGGAGGAEFNLPDEYKISPAWGPGFSCGPAYRQEEGQPRSLALVVEARKAMCTVVKYRHELLERASPASPIQEYLAWTVGYETLPLNVIANPNTSDAASVVVDGRALITSDHCDRVRFIFDDTIPID
jgi:hypothetical protein